MRDISAIDDGGSAQEGSTFSALVRFSAGRAALAAFILIFIGAFLALASFDPMLIAELAKGESRGGRYGANPFKLFEPFTFYRVNILSLAASLYLLYYGQKFGRRAINSTALYIGDPLTYFHSTIQRQPLHTSSIQEIHYSEHRGAASLKIVAQDDTVIKAQGVMKDDAIALVEAFERWKKSVGEP